MSVINSIFTNAANSVIGAALIQAGKYLDEVGIAAKNLGFREIIKVVNHVIPDSPFLVDSSMLHKADAYIKATEKMISKLSQSGFYSQQTVRELYNFLSEGIHQTNRGIRFRNIGIFVEAAGWGLCAYAAWKLGIAAIQYFRGRN